MTKIKLKKKMEGRANSPLNGKTEENHKMASVITCGAHVEI